jgi:aspartate racemase
VKTLGLIGGTSWLSTVEYYRLINEGVNARLGGLNNALSIIQSLNMADVVEIQRREDWDAALELLARAGGNLRNAGAEALVVCANTLHVIADRLEKRVGIPLIHIADATARAIREQGIDRVALLGTKYTMALPFFHDRLAWHGVTSVSPSDDEREYINRAIYTELTRNVIRKETRDGFLEIMDRMAQRDGTRGVILGCTEIPLLIKQSDTKIPVFDTTALHAAAAVDFALSS